MPDKMSQEKISLLRAYGAEVVICPTAVPPESPESYYRVADRLPRRSRARTSRTSTSTPRTRPPTTRPPAPRSGDRPMARSTSWSPGSAPAGRSPARPVP
jgi:Cysteine synthase